MAANANRGQRSHASDESEGLMQQTQGQLVKAQGKFIEAVMTMGEPMTDALRETLAMTGEMFSTSQRIAPFDRLLKIQLDLVHQLFDVQVGLANMIFEAQSDLMELPRRAAQHADAPLSRATASRATASRATASTTIDLRRSPEHPAVSTTK